jgi:Cu(I)/Ag(I) efflux system membrane fusion protein
MRRLIFYGILIGFTACGTADQKTQLDKNPSTLLTLGANSDAFNRSFSQLLSDYYSLKEDFIAEKDSSSLNKIARTMMVSADSLALGELKADSSLIETASTYSLGISAELKGLAGETTLDGKRRSFQMVSEQLYDLARTVQYKGAIIYHMYCAEAFSDQGANWLSNTREIRNPYIPKKQLDCGSVRDSIDFIRKK